MRLFQVLPSLLGLASLASLASAAAVKSTTTCPKSTTCPVSTSVVTKTTSQKKPVTKTITVHQTVTASAKPTTTTTTTTADSYSSAFATVTTTVVSTVTPTATVTSYYNAGAAPPAEKRDVDRRAATAQALAKCPAVKSCTTSVSTSTTTITSAKATSTVTVFSKTTVTTTPTVTATATITSSSVTTVVVSTSTITSTTTGSTTTTTATATFSSFYIAASGVGNVPIGSTLSDTESDSNPKGTAVFNNGNSVFALYVPTGVLYDTRQGAQAAYGPDTPTDLYFITPDILSLASANGYGQCLCQIDSFTLILSCNCNGATVFQTDPYGDVFIGTSVGSDYAAVTAVVQPILD